MSRILHAVGFGVIFASLTMTGLSRARELHFPMDFQTGFNVPRMETPPIIDGDIEEDEWARSVEIRGMVGPQSLGYIGRDVQFRLAWDETHLYLAARSSIRAGERLAKNKREPRSLGVVFDDSYEIGIDLRGANQSANEAPFFSKFILNALGAGEYQKIYPTIGQSIYNWNPDFDIANRIWQDAEGQRWWNLELAMDLDDLQMPRQFKADDRFGINLARNFKYPWIFANAPTPTGYLVSRGFPEVTLVESQPYVQIEKLDGLLDRNIDFTARIFNPGKKPATVNCKLRIRAQTGRSLPEDEAYFTEERSLTIPGGENKVFEIDKALDNPDGFLDFTVKSEGEAQPIYKYHLALKEDKEKKFLEYDIDTPDFPLEVKFNPVTQKLWLAGDTLDAKLDDRTAAVAMTYRVTKEGTEITSGRVERHAHYKFIDLIEFDDLAPGEYDVTCALVDVDDKVLLERTLSFVEEDESEKFAEWWDNGIGSPDQVLRPFEPIDVKTKPHGVAVEPVLRTYQLDALGLPRTIASNGGEVLTAPVQLIVTIDGHEHAVPLDGTVEITSSEAYRVRFRGASRAAGVRFTTEGSVEQDGLVDLSLTYEPVGEPVAVQELHLEWPVDDSPGNSMVVIGAGGNYCVRKIGRVPEGRNVVWDTLNDLGKQGSVMTQGNFYGNLWVGTEKRGLLWAGDSDEGWVPSDKTPAHSLLRRDGAVVIQNHFISTAPGETPFVLDAPRTIRFQYNASPFRPLDPGFRVNLRSAGNGFGAIPGYMLNEEKKIKGWTLLHPPTPDKSEWPEWYARWKKVADRQNREGLYSVGSRQHSWNNTQIALRGYGPKSMEPGVYDYFRADWMPQGSGDELLTKSFRDYTHHLMQRMVREGGMRQFYYDISFASKIYHNLTGGHGYFLPDGRIQPETNDDELRQFYIRSYAMMQENGIYPTGISGHATNSFCLKALPFMDAILDSEYPMRDPIDTFPSERMIAMSCPHTFGVGINHLGQMNGRWAALHDASVSGAGSGWRRTFDHPEMKHWGITGKDMEFIPYWRNTDYIEHVAPGMFATIWKRPHSLILGVINYGPDKPGFEEERELSLTLKLGALGIPAGLSTEQLRIKEIVLPRDTEPLPEVGIDPRTGAVTGAPLEYHQIRFFAVHWDENPVSGDWGELFDGEVRTPALNWGINRAERATVGDNPENSAVAANNANVEVAAFYRENSVLLRLENTTDQHENVLVNLDLDALGVKIDPETEKWRRFYQLYNVHGAENVEEIAVDTPEAMFAHKHCRPGAAVFDGYQQAVAAELNPNQTMYISIDRY